jgi:hypothetical protein
MRKIAINLETQKRNASRSLPVIWDWSITSRILPLECEPFYHSQPRRDLWRNYRKGVFIWRMSTEKLRLDLFKYRTISYSSSIVLYFALYLRLRWHSLWHSNQSSLHPSVLTVHVMDCIKKRSTFINIQRSSIQGTSVTLHPEKQQPW